MFKINKARAIISSLLVLAPSIIGFLFWDTLPSQIITLWGAYGNADGLGGKLFAVMGIPLIMLAFHWLCLYITCRDPKNKAQNGKAMGIIFWIVPVLSLFSCGVMYSAAFGKEIESISLTPVMLGIMFVLIGNYLPKIKQNNTLGIKIPWTLKNEENWNKTHRLSGKLWVAGGLLLLFSVFFTEEIMVYVIVADLLLLAAAPVLYSYCLYRKQLGDGTWRAASTRKSKELLAILVITVVFSAFLIGALFSGDIAFECGGSSLNITASYWSDMEISYSDIDSIDYREDFSVGIRTNGFGSARLAMGKFNNDELGSYTLYAYTKCGAYIVMEVNGKPVVIGTANAADTKALYDELSSIIG